MKIIMITGFLGSGKTSTLKNMILQLQPADKSNIVIIVNDFGDIGIDSAVISACGIDPVELISGCICCQLGVDLLRTIRSVYERYKPGAIIIEPSGIANPTSIKKTLESIKEIPIDSILITTIVDPIRWHLISDIPVIEEGVRTADILAITKSDLCMGLPLKKVKRALREINPTARIFFINNFEKETLIPLINGIKLSQSDNNFRSFSKVATVKLNEHYRKILTGCLSKFVDEIQKKGFPFIGHLKLVIKDSSGGTFYSSITGSETGPTCQGELLNIQQPLNVKIQAVLFQVPQTDIESALENTANELESSQ
jgi:G3E family GTPase